MTVQSRLTKILHNNLASMKHDVEYTTISQSHDTQFVHTARIQIKRSIFKMNVKDHWLHAQNIIFIKVSLTEWKAELYDVKSSSCQVDIVSDKFVQNFMTVIRKGEHYNEITKNM